ncbi:MAG: tetratricopeptide repeat protein [Pirellulales bacterium]
MRRLNVKLALWLVGITVFSMVGVHFLHGYQLDRNADFLKVQAEKASKAGNAKEAIKQYNQYLRHRDDRNGYKALAELVVDVAKEADATRSDKFRAYNILEEAIRRHSDLDEVRASLVDYTMMMRRFADAQDHISILKEHGKNDPELEYKSALCYFLNGDEELARKKLCEMVGFDEVSEQFAEAPPRAAKEIRAFGLLARVLRNKSDGEAQADLVIQQVVKWNPDSKDAHLMRGQYLLGLRETISDDLPDSKKRKDELLAEGKAEFDKAFELSPDDADAILAVAHTAMLEENHAKAQELLERARKEHPDRQEVYVRLAALALKQGNKDQANEQLQKGLEQAKDTRGILEQLIEVQFQLNDLDAVRATCEKMRGLDAIPPEYIRYQEARLKMSDGKIVEATRELEKVRPAMERLGSDHAQRVNTYLARCYELLGLPDQQLEVYRRLLGSYPNMIVARLGEAGALQSLGRHAEAETALGLLAGAVDVYVPIRGAVLQLAVNQEMSKPEAERNWDRTEKIAAKLYQDKARTPLMNQLLAAELLTAQGRIDEALNLLTAARKENPKEASIWVSLSKLLARDENNRKNIPQLLALAEKELGDVPAVRNEKIKAIIEAGGETAQQDLKKIEQGIEKFNESEQRVLMQQLGRAYLRVGDYADARRCWQTAIAKDPTNGRIRQLVFELAMERRDEEGMQAVLKEIRDSRFFGPENPLYKYCHAAHTLQVFDSRERDDNKLSEKDYRLLADVRKEVEEGIAMRGEWAPLWRVKGELDQLEDNRDGAITNYQRSLNYSRFNQETTARRLVALLYSAGRFTEANEALKYLSGSDVPDQFRQLIGDIKSKSGDSTAAIEMAKKDVQEHPENPMNHIWLGRLFHGVGKSDEAEQAFRDATKAGPQLPAAWELLVQRLLASRKKNEAVESVREASKQLSDDPLTMARLYQLVGDSEQADQLYQTALSKNPNDLAVLQQVVDFSFAANQPDKATQYLDQVIEKGSKSSDKNAVAFVAWARRRKAQSLAQVGDYQNTMAAVKLIEQNTEGGQLARADMVSIISALGDRPEPQSRDTAIKYFELLRQTHGISARQMSALAKLYDRAGQWTKARDMMLAAINNSSDDPVVFSTYARMLLDRGEAEEAERFLSRAEELLGKSSGPIVDAAKPEIRFVRARLLVRDGQKEKAAEVLEGLLSRPLPQTQLARLSFVAKEMEKLGLHEAAERLLTEYMSQEPRGVIAMAAFKGRLGNVAEAFQLLEEARKSQPVVELAPVALEILRYYPKEVNKERCQLIEQWVTGALGNEVDPQSIKLILAELYDLQSRYDDVIKIYRELLADPATSLEPKARVQNNLAFVLAAVNPTPERGAQALELVEDAMRVLGPRSDLLDTRAVAYLAQGKVKQAATDMHKAISDTPSIAKYYHLAQIEKQLGNLDAAREAMAKAQELRSNHNPFTPAERQGFERMQQELN